MGKFGWAYIGTGKIAHTTARELIKTEDQQIVAVWNRTHAKAEQFAVLQTRSGPCICSGPRTASLNCFI